jgi:hypothetical protein
MHEYDALKKMATSSEVYFKNKMHRAFFIGKKNLFFKVYIALSDLNNPFLIQNLCFYMDFYQVYA